MCERGGNKETNLHHSQGGEEKEGISRKRGEEVEKRRGGEEKEGRRQGEGWKRGGGEPEIGEKNANIKEKQSQ